MKYSAIKTKIHKVMESCDSDEQKDTGITWCGLLIDKYVPKSSDAWTGLNMYLLDWAKYRIVDRYKEGLLLGRV